jgi:RNA polymerase sigma-70 factor (ECF subfamily)
MDVPDDAALVARLRAGEHDALALVFDRYAGLAKAIALRIVRSDSEAEDVVQEVFMQVWRQADRFDAARGRVPAWITTIARTRALDRLRRMSARRETADDATPEAMATPPVPLTGRLVRTALDDLPADQRVPLELAYWEGLSQSEIAERLGEPLGTIKTRMRSGLLKLREQLAD